MGGSVGGSVGGSRGGSVGAAPIFGLTLFFPCQCLPAKV